MSIAFVAGTTAEIIKLSPVLRALQEDDRPYLLWNTAQHVESLRTVLAELELPGPTEHLVPESGQTQLVRATQVPGWATGVLAHVLRHRRRLRAELRAGGSLPTVVVHGDTLTTVLGAVIGRLLGAEVVHIEAGQRSGNLLHPLPEEINRRIVARIAGVHFAPTDREVENLRRERVRRLVVGTGANTAEDALGVMLARPSEAVDLPEDLPEVFGLVTLHRFEMLRVDQLLRDTLETLHAASRDVPLVFVAGTIERGRIEELGLSHLFDDRLRLIPKRSYPSFVPLLARASFVVTDSGGLQQECAVLGLPCAVHREATESFSGLGENLVLTRFDMERLRSFVADWRSHVRPSTLGHHHPSEVIVEWLDREGLIPPRRSGSTR